MPIRPINANPFVGFPVARLTSMQTKYLDAIEAVATGGQSYSINGRSFTRANLDELRDTLAEINAAIEKLNGTSGVSVAYPICR